MTEPDAETYAAWFKALADPTRIRILNLLARSEEPVCVCDIVDHFPLGQPTISHHLKVLRDVRFVVAERRGTFMHYRVNQRLPGRVPRRRPPHPQHLSHERRAYPRSPRLEFIEYRQ